MIDYQTYQCGDKNDVLVLELTGRLDRNAADFLVDCLSRRITSGSRKIVIDCGDLDHISSVGLGALVRIHSRLRKSGGEVMLAHVEGMIADILRIVHFDRIFHIYPSTTAACEALDACKLENQA